MLLPLPFGPIIGESEPKIILASASQTRTNLLSAAGVPHVVEPSNIDEEEFKVSMKGVGAPAIDVAEVLAEAKAMSVSRKKPGKLVVGADQVLVCQDKIFSKPIDRSDAFTQLQALRGQVHELISYAVIVQDSERIWQAFSSAELTVRPDVTDTFLNEYLDAAGTDIFNGPGGYRVESIGVQLFSDINGSHFTVLGLPLLALLEYLRMKSILVT